MAAIAGVLIESDWNLKIIASIKACAVVFVLIESDWNLKLFIGGDSDDGKHGINRIRLEFKVVSRHGREP